MRSGVVSWKNTAARCKTIRLMRVCERSVRLGISALRTREACRKHHTLQPAQYVEIVVSRRFCRVLQAKSMVYAVAAATAFCCLNPRRRTYIANQITTSNAVTAESATKLTDRNSHIV